MSNVKKINNHIKSVRDTRKITNAMYLIASSKMRKAKQELDRTRPYFDALRVEIKRIFRTEHDIESKYFYPADGSEAPDNVYGCLVITADKGLAGSYNMNVIKETLKLIEQHENTKLFVIGEYGRRYFARRNIPIEHSFRYTAQRPTMHSAREIASIMLDFFDRDEIDKIFVVYTDLRRGMDLSALSTRLLPFHRSNYTSLSHEEEAVKTPFEFVPDVKTVLHSVIPSFVAGYIYAALIDSFCSEQSARMTAMNAANNNADELLNKLASERNRARQAAITQELAEVSAGAKALKTKSSGEEEML